jgi:predicted Zn-ribbon and HTH transcriptional regulator
VAIRAHSRRAGHHGVPLFDSSDADQLIDWLELQARAVLGRPRRVRRDLECVVCGYRIVRATPPWRCPMCQSDGPWLDAKPRPRAVAGGDR